MEGREGSEVGARSRQVSPWIERYADPSGGYLIHLGTTQNDISVALQFRSKRPVPYLTLTCTNLDQVGSQPRANELPPGHGAARAAERRSEQYAGESLLSFRAG
jgi:hypothetical protein